jgi:hypothetical protein
VKVLTAHLFLLLAISPAFANCLKFEPAEVTLTGVIQTRVDPGPPNYGEDPKTDSKEEHLYLHLDRAVCVDANPSNYEEAVPDTKLMEMAYFVKEPFQHEWLGKHVSVTGTLFHAITAHHWTPALITPSETHILRGVK